MSRKRQKENDFSSLEIDLDEPAEETESTDIDSLDESFLDELDAELDKVAGEEDELGDSKMEESTFDDLELDVSDEDLALMEEFSILRIQPVRIWKTTNCPWTMSWILRTLSLKMT